MTRATGGKRPSRRSTILGAGNPAEAAPATQQPEATRTDPDGDATTAEAEQAAPGDQGGSGKKNAKSRRAASSSGKTGRTRGASSTGRRGTATDTASAETTDAVAADQADKDGEDSGEDGRGQSGKSPKVLTPASVGDGARVSLILHPDDNEMLQLARVKDKADANVRIRAMIACYRADQRLKNKVDRLARAARDRPRPR